jgi:hypothetical protein
MAKALATPFTVIVLSSIRMDAMLQKSLKIDVFVNSICNYIYVRVFSNTASAVNSSRPQTDGLHGEENHIILVFGVIAASNCAGVILKSVSTDVGTSTGTPPDNLHFEIRNPIRCW